MSNQSEALRLAATPIFERSITWQSQATIELRRLAAVEAQRDALLEALVMIRDADDDRKLDGLPTIPPAARAKIDAAIKAVEEGK